MGKPKILYVDDEPINLKLFEAILKLRFQPLTAADGLKGLEMVRQNNDIRVILSDMKMPNMTGIEFIKRAKQILPDAEYYVISGFEITEEIREALDSRMIRKYFQKPISFNLISAEIESVIIK